MTRKYEFTGEERVVDGKTLKRIKRLSDGLIGGFIETERNLSQEGSCFIYDNARVCGDAQVYGNAWVSGDAKVFDNAQVYGDAWVSGDARVSGTALVYGNAQVYDNAWVSGNALVFGEAHVFGNAWVSGDARVFGDARVYDNARVYGNAEVYGNARVSGTARVFGNAEVFGDAKIEHHYQVRNVVGLNWSLTSLPGGIQVGCKFYTMEEWKDKHVRIGLSNGLTEEQAKAYYLLMKAIRREQRASMRAAKATK